MVLLVRLVRLSVLVEMGIFGALLADRGEVDARRAVRDVCERQKALAEWRRAGILVRGQESRIVEWGAGIAVSVGGDWPLDAAPGTRGNSRDVYVGWRGSGLGANRSLGHDGSSHDGGREWSIGWRVQQKRKRKRLRVGWWVVSDLKV
jgi:hypothetical protein